MAKQVRFPVKVEVWVPQSIADGLEQLASDQLLSVSDHARQAFRLYLNHLGINPPPRPPAQVANGKHAQAA
jgi:hypothetical protein